MNIEFPLQSAYDANSTSIACPAIVDGARYRVLVTLEALQDHFGLESFMPAEAIAAFEGGRSVIEEKAEALYGQGYRGEVRLGSASF